MVAYMNTEEGIESDDEIILLKPPPQRYIPPMRRACGCSRCGYLVHTNPPKHFAQEDHAYCCSWCRMSNGKRHGKHCERKRRPPTKRQRNH